MGGGKARRKKLRQHLATTGTIPTKKHAQVKPGQKRKGAPQQAGSLAPVSKSKKRRLQQADKAAQAQGNALPLGFHPAQRVLCVGEGNFSFARALARLFDGDGSCLVATAYDSEEQAQLKYEDCEDPLTGIVAELEAAGATIKYSIDAAHLRQTLQRNKKHGGLRDDELHFDRICFNFPHIGLGIKDQAINIQKNQQLLVSFFSSAVDLLRPGGQVMVTLKDGEPYSLWQPVSLAHRATQARLQLRRQAKFLPGQFPGKSSTSFWQQAGFLSRCAMYAACCQEALHGSKPPADE